MATRPARNVQRETDILVPLTILKCGAGYRHDATDNDNPCKYCPANQYKPNVGNSECKLTAPLDQAFLKRRVSSLGNDFKLQTVARGTKNNECDLCAAGKFRAASSSNNDVH